MLLEAGAADVWSTPIYMKKNRPSYMLSVLCREDFIPKMEAVIFEQTTSIGIRRYSVARTVLGRRKAVAETRFGKAEVKICMGNGKTYFYPEYESVPGDLQGTECGFSDCLQRGQKSGGGNGEQTVKRPVKKGRRQFRLCHPQHWLENERKTKETGN